MTDFSGKAVIVTGSAQNIGLAIAERFLAAGAHVICADLKRPANERMDFFKTDIANEANVKALIAHTQSKFKRLDVLVNNAGICIEAPITETDEADWDRVMNINVKGVFLACKHGFDLLVKSGGGAIVNISSIEALGANPLHSAYAASKGAVSSFTHNLALEFGPHGISCNAIAPGWISTPFNDAFLAQYPDREKVDAQIKTLHPAGRLGLPADIAETAFWLASPGAQFISGQTIIVDGGRTAKLPLPSLS